VVLHPNIMPSPSRLLDPADKGTTVLPKVRNHSSIIQCHIPENLNPQLHQCEKLITHNIHKSCVRPVKANTFTSHPAIWLQEYLRIHKSCVYPVKANTFTSHPAIWLQEYSRTHKSCVCPVNPVTSKPARCLQEYV
jgi:hypothetical protein